MMSDIQVRYRVEAQLAREFIPVCRKKPTGTGGTCIRHHQADVKIVGRVCESLDEPFLGEVCRDDAVLHPEVLCERATGFLQ